MIYLTRRERFSSAHRMFKEEWSDEENIKIYGKCSNPLWHGHNYTLYVTVKGEINKSLGFVMNSTRLKEIIQEKIISKLDHRNMNIETDFMAGKVATTENLAISIWNELEESIRKEGAMLHCIRIEETENNCIEFFG